MKQLRVGILGQGRSGHDIHGAHLITDPRFKIAVVADELPDRRQRAQQEYGCETTADYREVLKRDDLDFIVNALPSNRHVPVTKEILKAGHNVLCEKPLARHVKDADALIALAKKQKKVLAIFQQTYFAPHVQKMREILKSGVLGRIVMIKFAANGFGRRWDWQTLQEFDGGNLLNTGPHPVGQALDLWDPKLSMPKVWCQFDRVNTFGDAEDHVKMILTAKGKPTVDLEISSCCAYPAYGVQIYGSCGGLTGIGNHLEWKYFDPKKAPKQKLIRTPMPGLKYCGEQLPWVEEKWDVPADIANSVYPYMAKMLYSNLYDCLVSKKKLIVTPELVRRVVAVMEECHRQNPMSKLR